MCTLAVTLFATQNIAILVDVLFPYAIGSRWIYNQVGRQREEICTNSSPEHSYAATLRLEATLRVVYSTPGSNLVLSTPALEAKTTLPICLFLQSPSPCLSQPFGLCKRSFLSVLQDSYQPLACSNLLVPLQAVKRSGWREEHLCGLIITTVRVARGP